MNKPAEPLVSVIINCYNGEEYLRNAIESILSQNYSNLEVIFWDNQSIDNSAQIFLSYKDARFKYYKSKKHTLLYEARDLAIKESSGKYITFLDVDDWWDSEKIYKQVEKLQVSDAVLCYSNYVVVNERKNKKYILYKKTLPEGRITNELLANYVVGILTIMIRRDIYLKMLKGFDKKYHLIGDFDFILRLSNVGVATVINRPLAYYRWHGNNESIKKENLFLEEYREWINENEIVFKKLYPEGWGKFIDQNNYRSCINSIKNNNMENFKKYFHEIPIFNIKKIKLIFLSLLPKSLFLKLRA